MLERDDIEELLGQAFVNDQGKNIAQGLDEIAFNVTLWRRYAAITMMAAIVSNGEGISPGAVAEEAVAYVDALFAELEGE